MSVVDDISRQLFATFRECVPLSAQRQGATGKLKPEDAARSLDRLYEQARDLRRAHRPGIVARARIVLALQRQLLAAGYPSDMSRQVLFSMILAAFVGKA